jgi:hypothetical protein
MYPTTGYTPAPTKLCARCGKPVECCLYALCEECQAIDKALADAPTPDIDSGAAIERNLNARLADITDALAENPPVEVALSLIDEQAELINYQIRTYGCASDMHDAKLCNQFGTSL